MHRLVISTVGTSLLTNQIRLRVDPKNWTELINITANFSQEQINHSFPEALGIIEELKQRAEQKLDEGNTLEIREASAELNGIYGLYQEQLSNGKLDYHCLITTDTYQGIITAEIIKDFLQTKVNVVEIYKPDNLSTANSSDFTKGIDNLLDWIDKKVNEARKNKYTIYFNLVGGFKALQGYMNTIGMFYANHIVYVFEGKNSETITIPRLPIIEDKDEIKKHVIPLTLLDNGASLSPSETVEVPEALVAEIDGRMTISNWGQLIWKRCKDEFLSQNLLEGFPRIKYADSFRGDYKTIRDKNDKILLHNTIAKVSRLLQESNGDTRAVGKQVEYYPYQGAKDKEGVDHFYIGKQYRVSCKKQGEILMLRHYGTHKYVEGKETT
ncbi:MAG: CRISPR-associated protein [Hapalosiphonaceae cyanobacterium JJU2]|nr:MAG: CRISPR-associated protein [Hapalosiphonaceae cyanobacterium JJU2]